jgi:hypothetical protein
MVGAYVAVFVLVFLAGDASQNGDPGAFIGVVVPLLAHIALGAVVRRAWALVLPVVLGVAVLVPTYDDDALASLAALLIAIYGMAAVAVGFAIGAAAERLRPAR